MTKPTFYITTPIYYPSDKLHIGQKKDVFALGAVITGHGIGDSRTVSMTDMQLICWTNCCPEKISL